LLFLEAAEIILIRFLLETYPQPDTTGCERFAT
jgi:hypothetical protein